LPLSVCRVDQTNGRILGAGWRMLPFKIVLTISRLLLAIAVIGVDHLLRRSCHLGVQRWKLQKMAVSQ
jgi:hypothetical protein